MAQTRRSLSIRRPSFFPDAVVADPSMSLSAPLVQTETYVQTKMGKTKKVQGKQAKRQARKVERHRTQAQEQKQRRSGPQNSPSTGILASTNGAADVLPPLCRNKGAEWRPAFKAGSDMYSHILG